MTTSDSITVSDGLHLFIDGIDCGTNCYYSNINYIAYV